MDTKATRVLIADNLPQVRSALRLLLLQAPDVIVADEAVDKEQVVALAQERWPDLILLEWELPGQNGSSALAELKAVRPELTVIALSARLEARGAALSAGADAFVSKLDPPERLLAAIHDCTAGKEQAGRIREETRQ